MNISESNFVTFCMKHYENRHCSDIEEFEEDLKRILHIKKLFTKYKQTGDLKERLLLNHFIILYNVFGKHATNILFLKLIDYKEFVKPFIQFLNFSIFEFLNFSIFEF